MSATTSIQWTDKTWNPVRGCSVVSPGCRSCYAMKQAHRFSGPGQPYEGLTKLSGRSGPQWTGQIRLVEDALLEPLRWRKPARVFVNSMSDLFHEGVPDRFLQDVFQVMSATPQHTYQVLTKRPERMRHWIARTFTGEVCQNVWLGVSVEDQQRADERIPLLLQTPAAVRFVSAEPLLGPLDLAPFFDGVLTDFSKRDYPLHWVIVGGESGPGARPCDVDWVRSIVHQCRASGVPVFVKQLGAKPAGWWSNSLGPRIGVLRNRKGGDPAEWPADLRVREWPGHE